MSSSKKYASGEEEIELFPVQNFTEVIRLFEMTKGVQKND